MSAKVTLHTQGPANWFQDYLSLSGATHFKGVSCYPTYPGVTTIGRVYYPQGQVDARVVEGAVGADRMFDACRSEMLNNPQVHIWETPANEASIWDTVVANNYVEFNQQLIYRFHDAGLKVIVGAINTGWPRLPHEDGGAMMHLVALACQGANGVSFHEYDPVDMRSGAGHNCLRYRHFHEFCMAEGYNHPYIYITECGIDQTDPPGPDFGHSGWRIVLDDNIYLYVEQLMWYESELQKDDYVKCATVFTSEPSGWESFNMYKDAAMVLAQAQKSFVPPKPAYPPIEEMAKGFYASEFQGDLNYDEIRAAGYSYVHLRVSSGLYADPTFATNWERAGNAGFPRSLWHFLEPEPDGQAAFFKDHAGGRQPELGIWGDFENIRNRPSLTRGKADSFLKAADRNFGQVCNVYTSAGWLNPRGGFSTWEAQGRKLWVAHWTDDPLPILPNGATRWEFWQHDCTEPFGPFPRRVCLDRFAGIEAGLPAPEPEPEEGNVKYFDKDGNQKDKAWWQSIFGDAPTVVAGEGLGWHVTELHDSGDPAGMDIQIVAPQDMQPTLWWPDGSSPAVWKDEGGGYWEVILGACYAPPDVGPYWLIVGIDADEVTGIGWLCNTQHRHPQRIIYELTGGPPPDPDPDPIPGDCDEKLDALLVGQVAIEDVLNGVTLQMAYLIEMVEAKPEIATLLEDILAQLIIIAEAVCNEG